MSYRCVVPSPLSALFLLLACAVWLPAMSAARLVPVGPAQLAAVVGQAGSAAVSGVSPAQLPTRQQDGAENATAESVLNGAGWGSFLRFDGVTLSGFEIRGPHGSGAGAPQWLGDVAGLVGLAGMFQPLSLVPGLGGGALAFDLGGTEIHFDQLSVAAVSIPLPFASVPGPSLGGVQINDFTLTIHSGRFEVSGRP